MEDSSVSVDVDVSRTISGAAGGANTTGTDGSFLDLAPVEAEASSCLLAAETEVFISEIFGCINGSKRCGGTVSGTF